MIHKQRIKQINILPVYRKFGTLALLFIALLLSARLAASAQFSPASQSENPSAEPLTPRLVRTTATTQWAAFPVAGMAYSSDLNQFFLLQNAEIQNTQSAQTTLVSVTPNQKSIATFSLNVEADDAANFAFDDSNNRMLLLNNRTSELIFVTLAERAPFTASSTVHLSTADWQIGQIDGIALDQVAQRLYLLDSSNQTLTSLQLTSTGADPSTIRRSDLSHLQSANLRGLALNPGNQHLYSLSQEQNRLYELNELGEVVATYELAAMGLLAPRALVFARSADLTDAQETLHLYLLDRQNLDSQKLDGQIFEIRFDPTSAIVAKSAQINRATVDDYVAQLIKTIDTSQFTNESPDPSGLAYVADRNVLLLSDSEVEEFINGESDYSGVTLWEMGLSGSVVYTANISNNLPSFAAITDEPTGVAWNPNNGHYYISDDSNKEIFDVDPGLDQRLGTADDSWTSFDTEVYGNLDPEGVAFDSAHDRIFVVDGVNMEVYEYIIAGKLVQHFDVEVFGVSDPESVEFNPDSATLFVLSNTLNPIIVETTTEGQYIRTIDITTASPIAPAGLAYAPASDGSGEMRFYISDRGIDNNTDPDQDDGKIFEMSAPPTVASGNLPPSVEAGSDQTITLPAASMLAATVTDDGLPNPPGKISTTWHQVSGPGSVTFANADSQNTMATFSSAGVYLLRFSATDGQLSRTDDLRITVNEDNHIETFETQIDAKSDDAEENTEGVVRTDSVDIELIRDITDQIVGLRFRGVDLPANATIRNASIQFQAFEVQSSLTSLIVQGELALDAQTFITTTAYDISSRKRTTSFVTWDVLPWSTIGEAEAKERTPNLAPVIQEIINQNGWTSDNSIAIIISGMGHRTAVSNEAKLVPNGAAKLHIEYKRVEFTTPTPIPTDTATSTPFPTKVTQTPVNTPTKTSTITPTPTLTLTSTPTPTPDANMNHRIYLPVVMR